jgi:GWxTD domain-containing protein
VIDKPLFAWIAVLCCIAVPRPASGQGEFRRPMRDAAFELSISQEFGEDAKPVIVVTTSIPYRRLVFFVRGQRYESRYRIYLELKDARGKLVRGEVWEESVATFNLRETTSAALMASSRRTFPVDPGSYRAVVTIEVIDTSRRFSEEQAVRVVGEGTGRIELAPPVFYTSSEDSLARKPREGEIAVSVCPSSAGKTARINPGAIYGDFNGWVHVVCSIVAPLAMGQAPFVLTARVRDTRGVMVLYTRKTLDRIDGTHASLCLDINVDDLMLGEYEIELVAGTADGAENSESEARFMIILNRGLLGEHIDDLVELLSLVADEKVARSIAEAPPAERRAAWMSFWRKRDPSASTDSNEALGEFLQRLRYVLANFSQHKPGWRTDMGRVYMRNGGPDKVEDRQENYTARSYQLWYYYSKGIVYIFEDAIGTGEYRLLTTEMI